MLENPEFVDAPPQTSGGCRCLALIERLCRGCLGLPPKSKPTRLEDDLDDSSDDLDVPEVIVSYPPLSPSSDETTPLRRTRPRNPYLRTLNSSRFEDPDTPEDDPPPHRPPTRKLLVLDLDETLVHSCFERTRRRDFVIRVPLESGTRKVYVRKRPHVDKFLLRVSQLFDVVIFTASLRRYAEPLLELLDPSNSFFTARFYREHCRFQDGVFRKDLSLLTRDLSQIIIVDNSPVAFDLQPENGIAITSWFGKRSDRALLDLLPWLERMGGDGDVYDVLMERRVFCSSRRANIGANAEEKEVRRVVGPILSQVRSIDGEEEEEEEEEEGDGTNDSNDGSVDDDEAVDEEDGSQRLLG